MLTRIALAVTLAIPLVADDWSQFRGPNGTGISPTHTIAEPSLEKNLIWKTPVPVGHSSPAVSGDKVFITAIEDEKLYTIALDRETGRVLWRREAPRPRRAQRNEQNNPASPTPVADGENV